VGKDFCFWGLLKLNQYCTAQPHEAKIVFESFLNKMCLGSESKRNFSSKRMFSIFLKWNRSVCQGFLKYKDNTHARIHYCLTKLVSCYLNIVLTLNNKIQHYQRNQKKTK
jgi:hypothetical protein